MSLSRTRVVGYVRVSTEEQAKEGASLAVQRTKLTAYCAAMDLDLVATHEDAGVSAKSLNRPGLAAALADLESGRAEGVLVAKLDRLTRNVSDLGILLDRYFGSRFALLSVGDSIDTRSAAGRLVLNVLTSVAQWEREAIAERVRSSMAYLKTQGVHLGSAPLGLRVSDEVDAQGRRLLVPDPEEIETARRIHELRAEDRTLREIAQVLTAEGRPTKHGRSWGAETVRRVLGRPHPPIAAQAGTQEAP